MNWPRFEVALGVVDGLNVVFSVSSAYQPLTVAVFLNGQLKRRDFADGWTETNPTAGIVTLAEAPIPGDVVQIFFIDGVPSSVPNPEEVTGIQGVVFEKEAVLGSLSSVAELIGITESVGELDGSVRATDALTATLEEVGNLVGVLQEC
jgi:hypothetical protein